ncbi:MAG: regulatory protein RecX [Bdellovibrionales bacterium]|nr:regulatory protein RecX [Bdellovibrionales bacterium]
MNNKKKLSEKNIIEKLQTYICYRTHSEYELECKLKKHFNKQDVMKALCLAKKQKWLPEPEEIAEQLINELHRKNRGWLLIQAALKRKHLPSTQRQEALEEKKCRWWMEKKFKHIQNPPQNIIQKMHRFLSYRGFEQSIIKKVIYDIHR